VGVHAYATQRPSELILNPDLQGLHAWDFSPNGQWIALANGDYVARVFEAQNGRPVIDPLRHGLWGVNAVTFSPDGRRLLTASSDGNARIWDLRPATPPFTILTLPSALQKLRPQDIDPEVGLGRLADRTPIFLEGLSLRLYGPELEELHQFRSPFPGMKYLGIYSAWQTDLWAMRRYDPDENAVLLWRPAGELTEGRLLDHPSGIRHVLFTRDDPFLITLGKDGVVRFWRAAAETRRRSGLCPHDPSLIPISQRLATLKYRTSASW
jgi:WD40 repeat protein